MFGQTFGHGTLRKLVIYFGSLFDNIHLNRYDADGNIAQNMRCPINYGPKEKFLARAQGNETLDREIAIQLPRMAFEFAGFQYDPSRKVNNLNKILIRDPNDASSTSYQYSPVPWNINFHLYVMVKNAQDGTFIIEQILPYFAPSWNAKVFINPDSDQSFDMPIFLNDISAVDTYEGDFTNRRALVWTLSFTVQAWFFGPTQNDAKLIKQIDLNYHVPEPGMTIADSFGIFNMSTITNSITPGLSSNNIPVNWYGDANASIRPTSLPSNAIFSDSNYGYMIDFTKDI